MADFDMDAFMAGADQPENEREQTESQGESFDMDAFMAGNGSAASSSVSPAEAGESTHSAPTWESGDGGSATLPVGEKNQWGGNLRTEGRKPLIRRDAKGKVNGYSTTHSMFVKHDDGRIAVVPTVVDGVELSTKDAARHYAETGEYWGMADDEEGAKKIANAVHDEHRKTYQEGWNNYIHDHWDDMGDEIRRDPGVRGERARRKRDARLAKEMEAWGKDVEAIKGYRERTKTTQVAPELFLTGDLLEDSDGNTIKPGGYITVSNAGDDASAGKDGQKIRLMEFTGVNDEGKPVFDEVDAGNDEFKSAIGKLHVSEDDFARMMGRGEGKVKRSPLEQVRLDALANTGDYKRYGDTAFGTATAIADYLVPFVGRIGANRSREAIRHLANIYEGNLDEYSGDTDDEKRSIAAMDAGLDPIRKGETREEYYERIKRDAEDELKKRVIAKMEAGAKLSETEQSILDKIVKGGVESGGYALEFALPGGAIFKGAKALNWGAKAVRTATMLGSAVPVVTTEAASRYQENITPEYGFDDNGEFKMVAAPDDEEEAVYKAIGGAIFDTAVEVGLEAATMGLLRGAGKASGWLLGKATPSAVRELGAKKFYKFMASETGQTLRNINRAYQDFTAMTQINSPLGELAEENVQALEKFLNLDGKTSEHKGFAQEWQDFKDNQLSWQTQWDIFLGLVAQLAIGSAKSAEEGIAQHISSTDARRDARMALKRSGISDEAISMLTPEQQKKLDDMWRQYSADPDALKENVKDLGISMRLAADELLSRESSRMAADLKRSGIEPEKFVIQTGEDGKPAFQQMTRFGFDGSKVPMNAMTDAEHGVTIVDQGDGTFHVMNDWRGLDAIPAYSFEEAQKKADKEVLRNQQKEADNKIAAQRLIELTNPENGPYRGRKVVSIPSEAALRWQVAQAVHDGKEIFGITRADQLFKADGSLKQPGAGGFRTPDGHIVVILDNVPSPAEMERVLAHEATGHEGVESATGRGANTVEFIQNAQAEGFSRFVLAERERAIQRFVAAGMDEATARMQVAAAMSTDDYAREAMARYAQVRLHQPTWYERKKHEANKRRRDAGENVPIDQSDLEVMLAEAEKQGAQGANDLETLPGDSGVRYEEGATDETGNGADEAPAQQADEDAGRDGQQSAEEAEARPEAQDAPGGETPDAGVVATIDNLPDLLKGAAVELVENAGDPSDPGHRVKTASKEEITAKQQEIVDALNDPDPQNFERFLDEMNNHACRTAEMMKFREEWQRLHPEVDINSTPQALANERKALELDIESAKESLANHPNSESLKVKLREAEKKLADFIAAHPDLESAKGGHVPATGGTQGVVEPSKTENGGQKLTGAEQQPMSESSFWNVMHRKGERRRVPVDSIKIPDTQFKENADPKTGVVKGQELGEYYENAENPIAIYERRDGTMEIVTGRHRLDAAKRSGWEDIDARIFREADGYTPEDMRLYDAVANILDEKGTVKDYVRFFDESGFSEEDAKSSGILNRQKGRMAFGIVQNATDDTRGAIDWDGTGGDGLISAEQAAIIAEAAPKQAALQRILVRRALDGVRGKKLAILARSLAEEAKNRKNAPKAEDGTQLDLFTSEEDVALIQQEEKRADYRAKKANEYKRIAENLRTAMRKGGRLDLNKDYAKELGISDPKDKAQLAAARDKAVERANYWENAVRLDDADKAQMDADLGIAPANGSVREDSSSRPDLTLESPTAEQLTDEERKRREKAEIKKRQEAPLKGSGAVNVQPEMDLGQTGQQDLFSPIVKNEETPSVAKEKAAERPAEYLAWLEKYKIKDTDRRFAEWQRKQAAQEPAKNAPETAPKKTGTTTSPEAAKLTRGGESASGADKVDDIHETNVARAAEIIAEQVRKNTKDESITANNVRRMAESLVTAIEDRDANALQSRFNGLNKGSVKAFEAITGLKMPSTQKGQHEVVDRFCGISPEERTRIDAEREAEAKAVKEARRKEQSLRDDENAASRFRVRLEDGKVATAKELVEERGWQVRVGKRGAVNETWIIDPKTGMGVKVKSEMREYLTSLMQGPAKNAPASAPSAEGTTTPPKSADALQGGKSAENATQRKYAELLSRLDEATKRLDAAVEAEKKSGGAIADQIASREAIIDQYRAELAVRRFEREHKNERLGQNWSDVKDRPYTSLTDNGIRERIANATTSIAQLKEELPKDTPKSSASTTPSAKPAFKRGDRVFLKGAAENQRVTFLKANADGTADVQVKTPGVNRYAPEKVETRTVPMGDVSSTGMKDTLTEAERKRLEEGVRAQQTIVMPNAAAAKEVRDAFDAIDFDTPELSSDNGRFIEWAEKWKLDPSKKKYQREWAQKNNVDFDTPEFDPDKFGRLVTGVGNLVDKLTKYGYKDFKSLATYIYEQDAAKYGRAKPVLQDVWNAVARARGLARVSDAQADEVYGIIEAKAKEVDNGDNGTDGDNGGAGGVRTAAGGGERPGGVLAGGRVRPENTDERVGGVGTGAVSGLGGGLAETQAAGEGASGAGGASEGAVPVADSAGHGERELDAGEDSSRNGSGPAAGVKKPAEKAADSTKVNPIRRDFVMTKAVEDAILEKRTADRVRNNIAAIKLIRELAKRDYAATPAEQETLAKFVGWGGLREAVFNYDLERAYDAERSGDASMAKEILRRRNISQNLYDLHKELHSILNDKEYDSAKRSSSTAFYTPVGFVRSLHDALRNLGVKGGRFLGPSAGTGNFASASGQYEKPVNWQFVEKDAMTGEILKALFPNQRVTIGGFEETKFPDGFFDFAIDNVPYADVPINDRSLSSKMFKIHDYFFAKTLAKLRPGGVMAFLTSTGTLDKTSPILRQFLTEHGGRIVGAVRLPNGFFSENAGTEAASDLVIVQKVDGRPDNSAFEKGVEYGFTEQWERRKGMVKKPLTYNGYFKEHPEQIVGKMEATSGQYGPRLNYAMPDGDMMDAIRQAVARAFDGIDRDALLKNATVAEQKDDAPMYDESGLRQGNVTLKDGKPFVKSGEMLVPVAMPNDQRLKKELMKRGRTGKGVLSDLFALRKAMRDLIDAQMADTDTTETDLAPLQKALGDAYDAFVKKNGTLHDRWVTPFVLLDKADGNRMLALERVVKGGDGKQKVVKSDIFTKRVISRGQRASRAETPKDALVISYSESGGINVPRIAELLGVDEETAIAKLKEGGDAFENPQTGRLEPSWEYLSGRVRAKLAAARAALEAGEEGFRANVEALEKVQPPMVKLEDTEIKFGATWVEPDVMSDFMRDAFGSDRMQVKFVKNEATGQWEIPRASGNVANNESPWGETSWDPLTFVLRVLNHGSMNHIVTDPVTKKKYLDERKTEANKLAAEKMHQAFAEFIMSSDKWAEPMYERYNAVMTDMVEIKLPNNVLPFRSSGMSESAMNKLFEDGDPAKPKKGREYQSAVIARGVLGGSSLCLAHCVGAGKTLEMQSIGMMGRRLGMFKKPMYVVPNHMLEQFVNEFVDAFPNANILKMSEDDVKPENRRAFFAQVANGDWDAIVVKRSTFSKKLAMSTEYQKNYLQSQIDDMAMVIEAMQSDGNGVSVDKANKIREKLQAKLEHLVNAENHDSEIVPFEELGIDQLFIDEAHNFKGLPIVTSQGRTGGLSQGDSQQAIDMQMKTEYVQSLHGGNRGVVFATGTPLSNAPVVESYVILKYLAPNRLKEQGLEHFDDFVGAFGRITTESEFSLDGRTVKERDKVSAFVNIPELMRLFKSVVDIVNPDQLDIPRPKPKYHMIDVDMTPAQEKVMEAVAREAQTPGGKEWRNKYMDLTWVAKYACISPKMLGIDETGNKVLRAVSEIKKVYDETADNKGAQLVFTDRFEIGYETAAGRVLGDAKNGFSHIQKFNLNEEMRDLLVQAGIPKEEIAIIQDIDKPKGDKDANKSALFAKVRSGEVRVLIGSRPKMGEGTNVQERLAAIHLLHPGWKPAEDEQAIGRIIRFGNTYKEGHIFYYLTKGNSKVGSYETKNHQIVGVKGRLIDQVMHGDDTIRVIEMDENAMDRDMLMGLASGNKALMELIDVNKRVHKLELNTESTASSARRLKMKAEATERELDRSAKEFEKTRRGIERWNEANKGKPFEIATPDGRTIDKVGEMAQYVSAQVSKQLTKDAYDRDETVKLGEINGIPVVATFDAYDDQKVKIAVPTLGIEREINYSGFIPDFSTGAMTAFKKSILDIVDPSYAEEFDGRIEDLRKQTKKMSADAAKLQKDFDAMSKELATLRSRQAQLEREVTPLVVQTVKDRKVAQYGNWFIEKSGGGYSAIREKDGKELRAATVKELIPLMDAEDFERPGMAATKTRDLTKHLKPDSKGSYPGTFEVPVEKVNFDTPELTPAEAEYAASGDKTPTEKVMREVYGMTNDEIATALRAAGMEPPAHVRKSDEVKWQQAEVLLSNPTYMAKLSRAVAKFPRPLRDYEIDALNILFRERQNAVNAAQGEVDDWKQTLDSIADGEVGAAEKKEDARKNLAAAQSGLARAKALMLETGKAKIGGASEQGRGLRANRGSLYQDDLTYAGIMGEIARIVGGAERVTPEMDAKIRELAKLFEDLDEQGLRIATERLKPLAEKVIKQTKDGLKVRKATERRAGDEAKRVTRNYEDALNQIEVGAAEVGGTLIGLSDQQYPSWGRWLKAIGEFHCFQNPDITEEDVINAILEDISPFMDGVDANQVRDALTGFGHNYKMSRYDAQRLMNGLRNISRYKRQLDWMDETNTMPPATGPIRDEPTQDEREWAKKVRDRKEEVPDAGRDERRLKSTLDTIKRNLENRIADLKRAIETGERIPAPKRKVVDDIRVRELRAEKDEWQKRYDELFGTTKTLTPEQKIAMAEKTLNRMLEADLVDLDRARHGDFSKVEGRPAVTEQYIRRLERQAEKGYKTDSPALQALRERRIETLRAIFELKKAKYEFGMTPEEVEALNARKITAREKAVTRLAERVATGDFRTGKPQPPMTKDQQKRYDELGEQMKRGRQKLAELRLEAENATVPTFVRKGVNFLRFVTTAQRALRATMDFSAVLRQAARMTLGHPVKAAQAFGKAWTAARSEASLLDVNTEILSDPTVQEAVRKFGLHIREVDAQSDRDVEMFHGMERNKVKIFGKEYAITDIPLFGEFMLKSERHYLTYLNAMSADLYTSIVNGIPGGATPWQKKMIADMINIWNGSAALSKERRQALQKAWVNDIFWAPQLAISRVQSAVGYDWWHPLVARGIKNADGSFDKVSNDERKTVAKVGLSEHMRSTVAMLAIGALLRWLFSDDDDKYDFSQADWFEKMMMLVSPKIGNTTIDLTGGESTFNKLVHQLATRSKRTGTGRLQKFGDFNGPSTWGAIGRYLQGKLSPSASTIASLWEGKDYVGEEYGAGKMVREMLVPLTFEDVKDQIVQNGVGRSLVTVPLSILGAGGSTYDRKPYENAVNRFLERRDEFAADVRGRIEAKVKAAKKLENQAKELKKDGKPVPQNLLDEIDRQKAETLNLIREARK